jgi:hypothetical protein
MVLAPATALAVPTQVTQQGRLVDDLGDGLSGEHTIEFTLFSDAAGSSAVWSESHTMTLDEGYYSVVLGADSGNVLDAAVLSAEPLYLGMSVDAGALMQPLLEVSSVPYAVMAGVATNLDGGYVDATALHIDGDMIIDGSGQWVGDALPGTLASLGCIDGEGATWDVASNQWLCTHPGNHYDSVAAIAAMGTNAISNPLNHNRYTDTDTIAAMGTASNTNSYNHARYSDTDAVTAVGPHFDTADAVAAVGAHFDAADAVAAMAAADTYVSNSGDTIDGDLVITGTTQLGGAITTGTSPNAIKMARMAFHRDGSGNILFTAYDGTLHTLNIGNESADVGGAVVGSENTHVAYRTHGNGDGALYFNIDAVPSIACTLLHSEDDTAAPGYYFATDGGNGYRSLWGNNYPSEPDISTFILKQSSDTNSPIEAWGGFAILCF